MHGGILMPGLGQVLCCRYAPVPGVIARGLDIDFLASVRAIVKRHAQAPV